MKRILFFAWALYAFAPACAPSAPHAKLMPPPGPALVERVVLVSVDGLRPDAIEKAEAPNLRKLIGRGAYCAEAETIRPSMTLPSHTSMVTGLDFRRHGVVWNNYRPGHIGHPTLFSVVDQAGGETAILFSKNKFHYLADPGVVDYVYGPPPPDKVPSKEDVTSPETVERMKQREMKEAEEGLKPPRPPSPLSAEEAKTTASRLVEVFAKAWRARKFKFTMVHFRECDEAGHRYGWMSPEYVEAVRVVDQAIGGLMTAIEAEDGFRKTALLVTADHGGSGRGHYRVLDPARRENVQIPWILVGPGIPAGAKLDRVIRTYDTTPTVLALLGLGAPVGIDGKRVREVLTAARVHSPQD